MGLPIQPALIGTSGSIVCLNAAGEGIEMFVARRVLIAIGSIVAAWLASSLVLGVLFGADVIQRPGMAVLVVLLGALIYRDIIGRERSRAERPPAPRPSTASGEATTP
ncbi:MAG TPA: hypothetical protein VFR93_03460 [Candidatus Limnocylindrales bacterium]|nr:hypothetical protein [Candidatus Limnocylindrales bacterium]